MRGVAIVLGIYCNPARDTSHREFRYNCILDRAVVVAADTVIVVESIVDSDPDGHRRTCTCLGCCYYYFSAFRVSFLGS